MHEPLKTWRNDSIHKNILYWTILKHTKPGLYKQRNCMFASLNRITYFMSLYCPFCRINILHPFNFSYSISSGRWWESISKEADGKRYSIWKALNSLIKLTHLDPSYEQSDIFDDFQSVWNCILLDKWVKCKSDNKKGEGSERNKLHYEQLVSCLLANLNHLIN